MKNTYVYSVIFVLMMSGGIAVVFNNISVMEQVDYTHERYVHPVNSNYEGDFNDAVWFTYEGELNCYKIQIWFADNFWRTPEVTAQNALLKNCSAEIGVRGLFLEVITKNEPFNITVSGQDLVMSSIMAQGSNKSLDHNWNKNIELDFAIMTCIVVNILIIAITALGIFHMIERLNR